MHRAAALNAAASLSVHSGTVCGSQITELRVSLPFYVVDSVGYDGTLPAHSDVLSGGAVGEGMTGVL